MKYLDGEEWRQVPGAREGVMLSNYGRPREGKKLLHTYPDKDGYLLCSFGGELGRKKVHQAMMITWEDKLPPNPNGFTMLDHMDGIKTNNRLDNFRWADRSLNLKYAYEQGLMKPNRKGYIIAIKKETMEGVIYKSAADMERDTGIPSNIISAVLAGRTKTARGYMIYRVNDIKERVLIDDGEIISGVNYDHGTWAEINHDDVILRLTDRRDDGYSQQELRDLVSKLAKEF